MSKLPRQRRPLIEALEPRLLFSATADIAVFDDGHSDAAYLAQAAAAIDLSQIYLQQDDADAIPIALEQSAAPATGPLELVFVDTSVEDYQTLVQDILDHPDNKNVTVIYLDAQQDGVAQITASLSQLTHVAAIHLISHGSAGTLQLGSAVINLDSLSNYSGDLANWQAALTDDADILIYGCDFGASTDGLALIDQLAALTQADIAASNDLTGHQSLGGDWNLEVQRGDIGTAIVVSATAQQEWNHVLAEVIYESSPAASNDLGLVNTNDAYQSFIDNNGTGTYKVDEITLQLKRSAFTADQTPQTITVSLIAGSFNGTVLGSNTVSSAALGTSLSWQAFSIGNVNLTYGQTYFIKVSTSSANSDPLVFVGIHNGGSVYANGSYLNTNGVADSQRDLAFEVSGTNSLPTVANAIPNRVATEGVLFNYSFPANTFADADGDSLTYTAKLSNGNALPTWLSFNAATRTFSGTPDDADITTLTIDVTANDGRAGSVTDTFDLVVNNVNDAPRVVAPIPNQNATEDSAFSYTFPTNTFTDDDAGAVLTYSAQLSGGGGLPGWLTFNSATRTFSGTPLNANVGTIAVQVTASDGNGGSVSDTFDIVVANTNDAPTVANAIPNQNATEDSAFSFTFASNTFNDVDVGNTLTYAATLSGGGALPGWLTFNAGTRTFSGTPLNANVGTIAVQVTASDGNGGSVSDTFDIVVANTNDAPTVANAIPNQNATEDSAFSFTFASNTFNDVDVGNTLTYAATLSGGGALPGWLTFNAATRTFSGTPLNANVGTIAVQVTASDGNGGSVSDTFDIVVANTNDAPTVANAIPNQNATEDSAFSFTFASNTFNDVDVGNTLTYAATLSGGGALPSWLTFNAATRTFSGTPLNADVGTIAVQVTASDGNGGSVSDTFDIVIANTNDAPTVANAIPNQNATEDSAFSFTFASNAFNDMDVGNTLTYAATLSGGGALPGWLTFNAATRTFSGTPLNANVGTIAVQVTASDGNGGSVSDTFDIVIANTNDAPTVANAISNQNATEDAAFSFTFASNTFTDMDVGNTLTYAATLSGGGALPSWLTFNSATRTFSGTPLNADVGTIAVQVTASDGNGGSVSDTFNIVVANTNDAPTVANAIPNQNATEDSAFSFTFASNTFNDVDVGNTLTYAATLSGGGALPGWLTFNSATRTFSGTPLNADVGTIAVQVTAADGNGGSVSDTFNIVVANTNDAPTVANIIPNQNATEDSAFSFTFASNTFTDMDVGNTLTYAATLSGGGALPGWLIFNAATRTFSGTPLNADVGTIAVQVTALDGNGGSVSDTFDIVVANTNDAPTVANIIPNQNATESSAFSFTFASNTFTDMDVGNTLTYAATLSGGGTLPGWLIFNSATRTFSGTPLNADVGTIAVQVTALDGNGGSVSDTFDIVVANTNDAPIVTNTIPDQNATEDSAFSFTFASNTFTDMDVGNTLTYAATLSGGGALPGWLAFNSTTRTFSGTPLNADVGTIAVQVTAADGNGGSVSDTFDIVIANTNDAPTVTNVIPDQNATEDSTFSFTFAPNTFNDVDAGNTLTYVATLSGGGALPTWLAFNSATRTFSGTPLNADVGTIAVQVTASDGNGGSVSDTFDIVVANTNDAPTIANTIPDQNATEDSAFSFTFAPNTFNDTDAGNTLTYVATLSGGGALPGWLVFNSATRTFSGTPLNADVGMIAVQVTASDGNGGSVSDTFDIAVANTNDAPTVANAIPNQIANDGALFNFTFAPNTFTDEDVGDSLTYSAQLSGGGSLPGWLSFNAATRTFSGTPSNADIGTLVIELTADDGHGGTVIDTFDLWVDNDNDLPTVAVPIPDQTATQDTAFTFTVAANTFDDMDVGNIFTYTAQLSGGGALPGWLSFNATTLEFSGTPLNADVGTLSIEVIANDGHGGIVSDDFDIVIANINDAPIVTNSIPNQTATEDVGFNFVFAANTFNDVDVGDTLTYSAQLSGGAALPGWLTFNAATRTFSGTPLNANVGTLSIEVIAEDGSGAIISDVFDLVITNSNDAPTVANPIPNQTATEDAAFNFVFDANTFNDVDVGDTLTYSAQLSGGAALPGWLTFNAATRTFSGTPLNANVGTLSIEVIAEDGSGAIISDVFDLVITNSNDAPTVANPIPNQTATEDVGFNFVFAANTFNDVDVGNTLTYSAQLSGGGSLPGWLTFNAATRTFSGTPLNANVGTLSIEVIAEDGSGAIISDVFDLVITNSNDAPTVANPIPNQTATEDVGFNFVFAANTFNDVDVGDTLTYSAQLSGGGALPGWLTFNAVTRTFSGTPLNANVGTLSIEVIAEDGSGAIISDVFDLFITNSNDAPTVANSIPYQTATEDIAFNFVFAANTFNDVDTGDTLTYSAQLSGGGALPGWLTFNAATRTFSGTPLNADVGSLAIEVIAADGSGATISDVFNIIIANSNDTPTIANAIPDQTATEDVAFNFVFDVNTFNDVDVGDTLTYSAQLSGGAALPGWLTFNAATRTFSGTPLNANVGTLSIEVIAEDGSGAIISDVFDLVITNSNDAPTIANSIPNQTATEDVAFNFMFAANTFNDVDIGDTLTYSAQLSGGSALPGWLMFDAATRTFSGTPLNANVGTLAIEVTAEDGSGAIISDVFDLVIVNNNDAPTIANPIPNQTATEDIAFNFVFAANTFNDVDVGDTLTYSAQLSGGGSLPGWLIFNAATRTFSGTPLNADVGSLAIEVIAADGSGATISDVFNIIIANSNDTPTIANAIPDQTATEDVAFNFVFDVNTFNDVDVGDTLTYSAQLSGGGSLPGWLTFNAVTRTFSGTPLNANVGTLSIEVIAEDGSGAIISDVFDLVITNSNDAPTITNPIPNQTATEDVAFNFVFAANTFNDVDVGDTLTYSAQLSGSGALPGWLNFNAATRTFSGTPLNSDVGTVAIEVIAADGNGGIASDTFNLVVSNNNDTPTVASPIPNQTATENAVFNFVFAANTFNDVDVSDTLVYSAQLSGGGALPGWLAFNAATRTFNGTPLNVDVGIVSIRVIANDGHGGITSDDFDIVIANSNDIPTVANAIPNQTATEDVAFNFVFAANTFNDMDIGDTLTYSAQLSGGTALPAWLTFNAATRTFSGTPLNADVGTFAITVTAMDGHGGSITNTFDLLILNTNDAPLLLNAIPDQQATEDSPFVFTVAPTTFADSDAGNTLSYSAQLADGRALPGWLTFNATTHTFSGTPLNENVGTFFIVVSASDGNGGVASDTFTLVVNNTNDAPALVNTIPAQQATEDVLFHFTLAANTFMDRDAGDTLIYSAQLADGKPLPAWLHFDAATQTFSGTPANADTDNLSITVIASDGSATVNATFQLTITNVNTAPIATGIAAIDNREDASGDAINLWPVFSDAEDTPAQLQFTVVGNSNPALVDNISIDAQTGQLHWQYGVNQFGSSDIILRATDSAGASTETRFTIHIASVNDAPTSLGFKEVVLYTSGQTLNTPLHPVFSDIEDGTSLVYSIVNNSNPALAQSIRFDNETGALIIHFALKTYGETIITVRAMDKDGAWVDSLYKITLVQTGVIEPVAPVEPPRENIPGDSGITPEVPPVDDGGTIIVEPIIPLPDGDVAPGLNNNVVTPPSLMIESDNSQYTVQDNDDRARYERIEQQNAALPGVPGGINTSSLLASLITPDAGFSAAEMTNLNDEVRRVRAEMDQAMAAEEEQKAVIAGLTFSVTTGLLIWSLRASSLLLALMSMLPLWRGMDPLPILDEVNKRKKELEQQRLDKEKEDKSAKEVGYLFDSNNSQQPRK